MRAAGGRGRHVQLTQSGFKQREAKKGQGAEPLAGFGAAPQAGGWGGKAPNVSHREAIQKKKAVRERSDT